MLYFFPNQVIATLKKLINNVDLELVRGKKALFPLMCSFYSQGNRSSNSTSDSSSS